jgi:hypothetical protein
MRISTPTNPRAPGILLAFPQRGGTAPPDPRRVRHPHAIPTLMILALLLVGLVIVVAQNREQEFTRDLPPEARALIFRQSLVEVGSTCVETYAARGPLREHCIEQARFILQFPECGPECRTVANTVLPHAHK